MGSVQTEAQFQSTVIQYAELKGCLVYHTHDSRRSQPGFPDLTMVRRTRLIFAELKREDGEPTEAQMEWIFDLRWSVEGVEVFLWRPSDWHEIERVLA